MKRVIAQTLYATVTTAAYLLLAAPVLLILIGCGVQTALSSASKWVRLHGIFHGDQAAMDKAEWSRR